MSLLIDRLNSFTKPMSSKGFKRCLCGKEFKVNAHYTRRRGKNLIACVAKCENPKCKRDVTYVGLDLDDVRSKVNADLTLGNYDD
jgi:hypothetical protein